MIYTFENVTLDTEAVTIRDDDQARPCEPKAFALLQALIENRERVISKDELIDSIWNGRIVSESALNSCVSAARRAVGDDGRSQHIIRTVPKRGFRFVAEVTCDQAEELEEQPPESSRPPSIAVMPFRNLSNDSEQDFLADGMLEDLVMTLSRIRWLVVIGSGTMFTYRGQQPASNEVATDLDVRYLLSGNVRKSNDRVRISVQLFDCDERRAIWADLYDRKAEDIFDVQDDITRRVGAAVEHELARAEQTRAARTRPENLDAWLAYQMAISRLRSGDAAADLDAIIRFFDQAIVLDPRFALAHAGRAFVEYWRYIEGLGDIDLKFAFERAHQAVSLDALNRALELNPSFAWSHHLLGITHITLGETGAARKNVKTAIRLSPRDTLIGIFYAAVSLCCLADGDYLHCVQWGRRAIAYPQPRWIHAYVLSALGHLGDRSEAREILTLISRVRPDFSLAYIDENFRILKSDSRDRFLGGLRLAGLRET